MELVVKLVTKEPMKVDPPLRVLLVNAEDMSTVAETAVDFIPAKVTFNAPPGRYLVMIRHPQFRPVSRMVTLKQRTEIEIKVSPAVFFR